MSKENDPWLLNPDGTPDPFAGNVNWGANYADLKDPDLLESDEPILPTGPELDAHENLNPEIIQTTREVGEVDEPESEVLSPFPEPSEPTMLDLDDGTQLTLEKEKGQWKGTASSPTGGSPQVYWGKTKDELILNMLKAQVNATKKIREQNAKLKFRDVPVKPAQQPQIPKPSNRALTADEIFEVKTQLESDPSLALDTLFQKKTGLSIDQLVSLAQQGAQKAEYASNQLIAEMANKSFLANNPGYYPDPDYYNFGMLVKWLAKYKLGENIPVGKESVMFDKLVSTGNYTAENLEEAFTDLVSDDLMVKAPVKRQPRTSPPVQVQNTEPAPAPRPDPRIVSQVTRPRAALGIGRNDVTPVKSPEIPKAPSVEDLDNLSDKEVSDLMAQIRRQRTLGRRSN